jgi:hypothetical protein
MTRDELIQASKDARKEVQSWVDVPSMRVNVPEWRALNHAINELREAQARYDAAKKAFDAFMTS